MKSPLIPLTADHYFSPPAIHRFQSLGPYPHSNCNHIITLSRQKCNGIAVEPVQVPNTRFIPSETNQPCTSTLLDWKTVLQNRLLVNRIVFIWKMLNNHY